jgi:glutamate-1-semialdehyde 2,1-aminomutase
MVSGTSAVARSPTLLAALKKYLANTRTSHDLFEKASQIFTGGQSHNARFFEPYPFFAKRAKGKYIWDVDGNKYTDYWMGHTALIMGHSPPEVATEIRRQINNGLLFGTPNQFAYELGDLISRTVPCAESLRFCTTGAEATMYAIRLARSFTRRKLVVKIAGGWHGYSSTLSVGVNHPYNVPESAGLLDDDAKYTRLVSFNSLQSAHDVFSKYSSQIACIIIEPVLGAGGVIPATPDFMSFLREECDKKGALLIFDEIITGFRLALGGAQEYYGIKPDLCTLGKIIGGGLPASAIAGQREIMSLADVRLKKRKEERAWIGGGTFSENALPMRAGAATIRYLMRNKKRIYESLGDLGEEIRTRVDQAFSENKIRTKTTGLGSLFATHFLNDGQDDVLSAEDVNKSKKSLEVGYYTSLIGEHHIFFIPGHIGAISTAHSRRDISVFADASREIAKGFTTQP